MSLGPIRLARNPSWHIAESHHAFLLHNGCYKSLFVISYVEDHVSLCNYDGCHTGIIVMNWKSRTKMIINPESNPFSADRMPQEIAIGSSEL